MEEVSLTARSTRLSDSDYHLYHSITSNQTTLQNSLVTLKLLKFQKYYYVFNSLRYLFICICLLAFVHHKIKHVKENSTTKNCCFCLFNYPLLDKNNIHRMEYSFCDKNLSFTNNGRRPSNNTINLCWNYNNLSHIYQSDNKTINDVIWVNHKKVRR